MNKDNEALDVMAPILEGFESAITGEPKPKTIESMQKIIDALKPEEPDMTAHDGPCCSELVDGHWISIGCSCGNTGDCESAETWRNNANRWIEYQNLLDED